MWNQKKYNDVILAFKKKGEFLGKHVKSKEKIYEYLAEEMNVSSYAVKSWTRLNSNGPCEEDLKKLEAIFGTTLTVNEKQVCGEKELKEKGVVSKVMYSEFVKNNIKTAYDLILEYYSKNLFLEEEPYIDLLMQLKRLRVCIPENIFEKINTYLEQKIEPMIYDKENYLLDTYDETMGYFDENQEFCFKDEISKARQFVLFMEKFYQGEDELIEFGMTELYPILVN